MPRLFVYDGRTFPDPDPGLPVDDVRRQLADFFCELANADHLARYKCPEKVMFFEELPTGLGGKVLRRELR